MKVAQRGPTFRRYLPRVLIAALIGVVFAAAWALVQPKTYTATARSFVSTKSADSLSELQQGSSFTQQQISSYTLLATTPAVLGPVATALHDPSVTSRSLATKVLVTNPVNTSFLVIQATSSSPGEAQTIANAVAHELGDTIESIETPAGEASSPVKVTVVESASKPASPSSPKLIQSLLLGAFGAGLLGAAAFALRRRFDTTIREESDIAEVTAVPIVGKLPTATAEEANDPRAARSAGALVEAIRVLRTNVQYLDRRAGKSFVITSPRPGDGKTTVAVNLALALADVHDRVLLVDADLRKPQVGVRLDLDESVGLSDVLIGRVPFGECVQPVRGSGLQVLTAGHRPPNPSELLDSPEMRDLLASWALDYEWVIVDSAPTLNLADTPAIASSVGGVLLVARGGKARRADIQGAEEALAAVDGSLKGIIFNCAPSGGGEDYYAYYYGAATAPSKVRPENAQTTTGDTRAARRRSAKG